MELTRLAPFRRETDDYTSLTQESTVSVKSRMISSSSVIEEGQSSPSKTKASKSTHVWSKWRQPRSSWHRWRTSFDWRTGVQVGFGISILVFAINVVLLLVGAIRKPGYKDGIGTLHRGTSGEMSRLSTAYHVLINILSTGLLTSSSYCMQLLCAPRREDIDAAHARGDYVDVGILSFRNLRFIPRRRSILVLILAATSIPLHLLYNSAIFEVTAGQNYAINFVDSRNTALLGNLKSNMTSLTNNQWKSLYNTKYVPNSGDLYLVIDSISFDISVELSNTTWQLTAPDNLTDYSWIPLALPSNPQNISIPMNLSLALNETSGKFVVAQQQVLQRVVVPVDKYSPTSMPPFDFPTPLVVDVADVTWKDVLPMNPDSWIYPPFHVGYAFSEPLQNSNSVQISLAFMLVVVACNAFKVFAIYRTLKEGFSSQVILTLGDGVSSFLERPDVTTLGLCTLARKDIIERIQHPSNGETKPWKYHSQFFEQSTRERWASNLFIWSAAAVAFFVMIYAILLARPVSSIPYETGITDGSAPNPWDWNWATTSTKQVPIAQSSFSTGGVLFNAWLANAPQLVLSMAYFAVNRMCTSICFIREWNDYAITRRGLRVTDHSGEQRPAHFLQMPYRWAVPLTAISGFLHWLLSQALFLVLLEIRDTDGTIIDSESRSTVGYSNLSLLVLSTTYFAMLFIVVGLQLRKITLRIPPANHCSLVISAACHPPPEDVSAQLKQVQWGIVRKRFGGGVGHCSFTSEEVTSPEEGNHYA